MKRPRRADMASPSTVDATCMICGPSKAETLPLESTVSRVRLAKCIVRCTKCGLRFAEPLPTPETLRAYYETEFERDYLNAGLEYMAGNDAVAEHLKRRLARIEQLLGRKGRIIDIGVGSGTFVDYCKSQGWETEGTELTERKSSLEVTAHGIRMHYGDLVQLALPADRYDAVHLSHVLEHVTDPVLHLREIRRILKPGGLVVVEVPQEFRDLVFGLRRLLGVDVTYKVATPHLYFFCPGSLTALFRKASLDPGKVKTFRRMLSNQPWVRRMTGNLIGKVEAMLGRGPLIEAWGVKPAG